jgi:hypothetical protein
MKNHENPNGEMIDLGVHRVISIILPQKFQLQADLNIIAAPKAFGIALFIRQFLQRCSGQAPTAATAEPPM